MGEAVTWASMLQQWLRATFPMIAAHNFEMAKGDRGVLTVGIDVDEMQASLSGAPTRLDPIWVPADEFIKNVRGTPSSVSPESARRWEDQLRVMDPRRDVALFLASKTADPDGTYFTRFIVTHDGSVPIN